MWRLLARVGVVVLVLLAGLGFAASSGVAAQTVAEVEVRDRLIANQEALLNVYRCMFDVDTQVVPGGCSGGAPSLPPQAAGQFSGTPTTQDIAVRDQLISEQEALLNIYRCQFNIDTEIVPGGCQDDSTTPEPTPVTTPENLGPVPVNAEPWSESMSIGRFIAECGWWTGIYRECHNHPEDTNEVARRLGELYGCDWDVQIGICRGYDGTRMWQLKDDLFCNGWILRETLGENEQTGYCYHPDHPIYGINEPR